MKGKLTLDNKVLAINYAIETVNGIVYLIGIAQNQSELDRVIAHSRTINFTGAFFGGGGDPVAETGGQFNIDGGPDYTASGIFAGAK